MRQRERTFANCCNFEEGSREVVINTRGSSIPVVNVSHRSCNVYPLSARPLPSRAVRPGSLTILGRVHLEFALAGAVAPRCLLALGEQVTDCLLALPYLLLLLLERFRVQELAALAGFAAELGLGGHKATGSAACKAREKSPCLAHHGIRSVLSECSVGLEKKFAAFSSKWRHTFPPYHTLILLRLGYYRRAASQMAIPMLRWPPPPPLRLRVAATSSCSSSALSLLGSRASTLHSDRHRAAADRCTLTL
jgi:hypothetical protein